MEDYLMEDQPLYLPPDEVARLQQQRTQIMEAVMRNVSNRVTTHGAQNKGTSSGRPVKNRGGSHAQHPAQGVGPANSRKNAFPSTGGMRRD